MKSINIYILLFTILLFSSCSKPFLLHKKLTDEFKNNKYYLISESSIKSDSIVLDFKKKEYWRYHPKSKLKFKNDFNIQILSSEKMILVLNNYSWKNKSSGDNILDYKKESLGASVYEITMINNDSLIYRLTYGNFLSETNDKGVLLKLKN